MITVIATSISRAELRKESEGSFSDLVKAVVDVRRGVMAIGGELHADEEALLLDDGSLQQDLWGINLYPSAEGASMIEFDSMINVRPRQGNRSRTVESPEMKKQIVDIVNRLVKD